MVEKDSKKRAGARSARVRREKPEFEQQIVDIARVTRVMAGGKRMRFRVCLVIGDKKGRVGMALAKGRDVPMAVQKAYRKAENNLIKVNLFNGTIPHEVIVKYGAARVMIKPAPRGSGIIAGGPCRIVLSMAGVENAVAKIMGANNKVNNVKATINALTLLKPMPVRPISPAKIATAAKKEEEKSETAIPILNS